MSDSLKEQLMKLGFKAPAPEKRPPSPQGKKDKAPSGKPATASPPVSGKPHKGKRPSGEMDLAKAYAIRAQKEKDERIEAEKKRQEEARQRREARTQLKTLLDRARLNQEVAEFARHFDYGGKIRRVHVTAEQLKAINAGELAVVQLAGGYHVVSIPDADEAERILPGCVALKVDPDAPVEDDYSDPRYQVPDDLIW